MSDSKTVEVFQPRDVGQFYDKEDDEFTDELAHTIRDLTAGMVEAEDLDAETFGKAYTLAGVEEMECDSDEEARKRAFETWQNAPQTDTSDVFREQNERRLATSMSTGDIVRVDGTAYLCESFGWAEVEEVSC